MNLINNSNKSVFHISESNLAKKGMYLEYEFLGNIQSWR
jgi:hypothetical protein